MVCDSPRARRVVIKNSRITEWFEEPGINDDGVADDPYGETVPETLLDALRAMQAIAA
jgi:thioredoxin-dependent peroxiredoxin